MGSDGRSQRAGPGLGFAAFAVVVFVGGGASLLVAALAVGSLVVDARRLEALAASGVLEPGAPVEAWHDHGRPPDGSSGCAVQGKTLVRWDGRVRTARVRLDGAAVTRDGEHVRVERDGEAVACPVGRGPSAEAFEALLRARALSGDRGEPPKVPPVP